MLTLRTHLLPAASHPHRGGGPSFPKVGPLSAGGHAEAGGAVGEVTAIKIAAGVSVEEGFADDRRHRESLRVHN